MCRKRLKVMICVLVLVVGLAGVGSVQAAVSVDWQSEGPAGPAADSTDESSVVTDGSLVYAYNFGAADTLVANGVTFEGTATGSVASVGDGNITFVNVDNGGSHNFSNLGGNLGTLLDTARWAPRTAAGETVQLNNLTAGQAYLVQFYASDTRGGKNRTLGLDVGTANEFIATLPVGHDGEGGTNGMFIIGTFTADASGTAEFTLSHYPLAGNGNLNILQVRATTPAGQASGASPSDGETDVIRDKVLTWGPGKFSNGHEVYFGNSFEDVNSATMASEAYKGPKALDDTSFDPGRMEFSTTYFWRIDEVNDSHPEIPWKGEVWQFEVEPEGYLVDSDLVAASASSRNSADEDPNNTINDVGLNPDGSHSDDKTTMWLSAFSDPGTAWIRYDLSAPQKLLEMLVWNHNTQTEGDIGYGIKDALIEVSADGINFTSLGTVELAQAAETTVDLQNLLVQSVRITAQSNWGDLIPKYGLSEVRLYAIPNVARELSPADGAADVDPTTAVLTWRAGRDVDTHKLYISTDEQAVIDGTAPVVTLPEALYAPDLDLGTTYYWRVDEVNDLEDPAVWAGSVQSFSTSAYIVVDDMESYKSEDGKWIWETWTDGYDIASNGALLGHGGDDMETGIVHGGSQSLPYYYGQDGAAVSEATRPIDAQDWSDYGIKSLSLFFYGDANNVGGQLYVKINNGTPHNYQGAATDIQTAEWFPFTIDLTGVTIVNSLTIGVTGGSGMAIIDDIRLLP